MDEFYHRSNQSHTVDLLTTQSISAVQMLLLSMIYHFTTKSAARAWISLGLATRTAQALGLHIEATGK